MHADVEKLLVGWLKAQTGYKCVTETPGNLAEVLPVLQIARYGGNDSELVLDRASVSIDVYAATRAQAWQISDQVRGLMLTELPGHFVPGEASISRVRTINAPRWAPYDNTSLRRFYASYMVTLHTARTI